MKRKIDPKYYFSVGECIGTWQGLLFDKGKEIKASNITIQQQINRIIKIKVW